MNVNFSPLPYTCTMTEVGRLGMGAYALSRDAELTGASCLIAVTNEDTQKREMTALKRAGFVAKARYEGDDEMHNRTVWIKVLKKPLSKKTIAKRRREDW